MDTQLTVLLGLGGLGILLSVVSSIWLLVLGFRSHVFWGLAIMFLPGASLIYGVLHWGEAQEALLMGVVGGGMLVAASVMMNMLPAAIVGM